jgi:hypothetical protein
MTVKKQHPSPSPSWHRGVENEGVENELIYSVKIYINIYININIYNNIYI